MRELESVMGSETEAAAGVCPRTYSVRFFLYQCYDVPVSGEAHLLYVLGSDESV